MSKKIVLLDDEMVIKKEIFQRLCNAESELIRERGRADKMAELVDLSNKAFKISNLEVIPRLVKVLDAITTKMSVEKKLG